MKAGVAFVCTAGLLASSASASAGVSVIFSSIFGEPTSIVPLGPGLSSPATFTVFTRPFRSPDGSRWMMQASTDLLFSENRVLVVFDGTTASTVLREGAPAPWAASPETIGFFESRMGINNAGQFCFSNNTQGGPDTSDQYLVKYDGTNYVVIAQENQPAIGGGNYLFTPAGMGITNGGAVGFYTNASAGNSRCILGSNVVAEANVTIPGNQANGNAELISYFSSGTYTVSPDGSHTMYRAVLNGPFAVGTVLVRDGQCVLRESDSIAGIGGAVNGIIYALESSDGNWFARGTTDDNQRFVLHSGALIARTGAAITPAHVEHFDADSNFNGFFLCQGNNNGDYLVGGWTDNPDPLLDSVLVLNGTRVFAREGDMVDLNNNHLDDDNAFIYAFQNDNGFLTNDAAYFNVYLRNSNFVQIGQAFVRRNLSTAGECAADINNDMTVNVTDLLAVITTWGGCGNCGACPSDVAPAGGDCVVNVGDLLRIITSWGACP